MRERENADFRFQLWAYNWNIVLLIDIKETIDINILKITFISVLATFLTILIFIIIYYINNIFHKYYDIKHT